MTRPVMWGPRLNIEDMPMKDVAKDQREPLSPEPEELSKVLNCLDAYVEKLTGVLEHGDPDRGGNIHYWDLRIAIREAASLLRKQADILELSQFNIRKQAERIMELERENGSLQFCLRFEYQPQLDTARAQLAAAHEREGRLREALAPFAALATEIENCARQCEAPYNDHTKWSKACQWDDLLRARAALAEEEKGNDG